MKDNLLNANFKIDRKLWSDFKIACKSHHTDGSKQIRLFIESFLKHHKSFKDGKERAEFRSKYNEENND